MEENVSGCFLTQCTMARAHAIAWHKLTTCDLQPMLSKVLKDPYQKQWRL